MSEPSVPVSKLREAMHDESFYCHERQEQVIECHQVSALIAEAGQETRCEDCDGDGRIRHQHDSGCVNTYPDCDEWSRPCPACTPQVEGGRR